MRLKRFSDPLIRYSEGRFRRIIDADRNHLLHSSCVKSILKGFLNGAIYGAKIRAPHAFVMTFLFRNGTLQEKLIAIIKMTLKHSKNLGTYVGLYKALICMFFHGRGRDSPSHIIVSGFLAGMYVFSGNSAVNTQINMYVLSRIIFGLANVLKEKINLKTHPIYYKFATGIIWGTVMMLFEHVPDVLQKSMVESMEYLYHDSNK